MNNYSSVIDKNKKLGLQQVKILLRSRLSEKAPGKIQFLAGPRQVGKTTLLLELAGEWGEVDPGIRASG